MIDDGRTPRGVQPGSMGFTVLLALSMAVSALSIDALLPILGDIREEFGLAPDSSQTAALITVFMFASGLALLPAGLLADRYGRRVVLLGGMVVFTAGAVATALATGLGVMLAARFVWGLGAAGPRVAALAMVRDVHTGERMAKQMSFMMAVFILVPITAPNIGALINRLGPWRLVIWFCVVMGLAVLAWATRLPETLAPEDRRSISTRSVLDGMRTVVTTPGTLWYLGALVPLFGVFMAYLSGSELIVDDVYGLPSWFPLFFAGTAIAMGAGMIVNGRIVERIGLDRLTNRILVVYTAGAIALAITAIATDGRPPFWLFTALLVVVLAAHGVLIPNLNSAAMRPLGHVAGLGSALLGMIPTVVGSVLAAIVNARFDGTITPFSIAFALSGTVALVSLGRAVRRTPRVEESRPASDVVDLAT